jgi:hypothetical protein
MKVTLLDAKDRVSRLLHRSTPGGELIYLDLRFGYRGELFSQGYDGGAHFFEVRCRRMREPYRWDPADAPHLIQVRYQTRARLTLLHHWSKGTLIALLAPIDRWTPSTSAKWTCPKEVHEDPNA